MCEKQRCCRSRKSKRVIEFVARLRGGTFRYMTSYGAFEICDDKICFLERRVDTGENKISPFRLYRRPDRSIKHHVASEDNADVRRGWQKLNRRNYWRGGCMRANE